MTKPQSRSDAQNPLLSDWTGPFGLPPLPAIKPEHFRPAFDRALGRHRAEIDAISVDPAAPSFGNTIEALEKGGRALDRVSNVFFVLAGADTGAAIEAIEREISPLLARHSNALRAGVLGSTDGLVSNLSLVMGVAGSGAAPETIVVAGLAGLVAGSLSMALGEYLSVQSARELLANELRIASARLAA